MKLVLFHQYDQLLAKIREVARCCAKEAADWKICRVQSANGIVHLHDRTMNELSVSGGEYRVGEIDRVDIAADALDELKQPEYDGKTIVFTVRGNYSNAKIPATIRYVEPPPVAPTLTDLHAERHPEMPWTVMCDQTQILTGTNLKDATVKLTCGEDYEETLAEDMFVSKEDTKLVFHVNGTMYEHGETGKIVVTLNGQSAEHDIEVIAGD